MRYRTAMGGLSEAFDAMVEARTGSFEQLLDEGYDESYAFESKAATQADATATRALLDTAQAWADAEYPATRGPLRPGRRSGW